MSASIAPRLHPVMTVKEYYRHPAVRARIREYCGGTDGGPLTCAHLVALTPGEAMPTWESATRHPPEDLDRLLDDGADVARSMLDAESLIFYLDLDYLNADHPAEAFLHSADVFFTLEPTYRAAHDVLRSFGMAPLEVVTGRGHHFAGRIPWSDPVIQHLADLAPEVPAWHASIASRHPACTHHTLDERQARAAFGLGMLTEHLAHRILRRAAPRSATPVVLNGTEVGAGPTGRACVSIDLSYAGDPLDTRNIRVAFGAYQLHQLRADIFGSAVATMVPTMIAVPRAHQSLYRVLTNGRFPPAGSACGGGSGGSPPRRQPRHRDAAPRLSPLAVGGIPSRVLHCDAPSTGGVAGYLRSARPEDAVAVRRVAARASKRFPAAARSNPTLDAWPDGRGLAAPAHRGARALAVCPRLQVGHALVAPRCAHPGRVRCARVRRPDRHGSR